MYRDHGVVPKDSRSDNFNKTPEDVSRYLHVQPGDLVVNKMKAWSGSVAVSQFEGIVSGDYLVCSVAPTVDPSYLHFLLRSSEFVGEMRRRSVGIRPNQERLYWDDLAEIRVPLPSQEEQRRIGDYLDEKVARIDYILAARGKQVNLVNTMLRSELSELVCASGVAWIEGDLRRFVRSQDAVRIPLSSEKRAERQGPFSYYGASGVIDSVDGYLFEGPRVLLSEDGANLLIRSSPIAFVADGRYWVNNHAHILQPFDGAHDFWAAHRVS